MERFRSGAISLLVCTEILGRGIDFVDVNLVVNFDLPTSIISYIHRVGRTGRAGKAGRAITFFTQSDLKIVRPIATVIHQSGYEVPEYLLKLSKVSKGKRKDILKKAPKREKLASNSKWRKLKSQFGRVKKKSRAEPSK